MPIYEYRCNTCQKKFEYLVFGSGEPEVCPACNGHDLHRLMSACGFLSKNSQGKTVGASAGASSCGGCAATSCSGCGH